jgi:formylmethanofuran dehydrogenase subunit D
LVLFAHNGIYDADALSRRSEPLQSSDIASSDTVYVNPVDLISIGFKPGDLVSVEQDGRFVELTLATSDKLPEGSAMVSMGRTANLNLNASDLSVGIIGVQS